MGFQATVIIHMDALHTIESDPDFGKNLAKALLASHRDGPIPFYASSGHSSGSAGSVIEVHHADFTTLVAAGGNTGVVVASGLPRETGVNLLRVLASDMGYTIRKKAKNPTIIA